MEKAGQSHIEHRFAQTLVAQMLQRAGATFSRANSSASQPFDFLIQNGAETYAIDVKYAVQANDARDLWQRLSTETKATGKKATPHVHLVLVTGRGDEVFTDATVAPLLQPDRRTSISVLSPSHRTVEAGTSR